MDSERVEFTTSRIRWVAIGLAIFIAPLIFMAFRDGEIKLAIIFLGVFGTPISLLYIYSASVAITDDYLALVYPFGSFQIRWDEVENFAVGYGNLKFYNSSKSVTLPSTEFWSGICRNRAIESVGSIIEKHGYKHGHTGKAFIPTFFGSKYA